MSVFPSEAFVDNRVCSCDVADAIESYFQFNRGLLKALDLISRTTISTFPELFREEASRLLMTYTNKRSRLSAFGRKKELEEFEAIVKEINQFFHTSLTFILNTQLPTEE